MHLRIRKIPKNIVNNNLIILGIFDILCYICCTDFVFLNKISKLNKKNYTFPDPMLTSAKVPSGQDYKQVLLLLRKKFG